MPAEPNEKMSLSAPKWILTMIATALVGGAAGMATGSSKSADAVQVQPVGLTRSEVQQVAGEAETRAKTHAELQAAAVKDDCRRDLTTATTTMNNTLIRLETKLDSVVGDVSTLKVDVATIKGRRR